MSPMSINKGRTRTLKSAHANLVGNSPLSSLSLLVKSNEREIQLFNDRVNSARGKQLEHLQELFR